jgi:RimJ/RimL family protein N-acetyltransferase
MESPAAGEETERLRLEPWTGAHTEVLVDMNADPEVMRFIGAGLPLGRTESEAASERLEEHWRTYGFGLWAAVEKASCQMIGYVGLSHPLWLPAYADQVEVGWRLRRDAWGRGYATEGATAALRVGFQRLGLSELLAFVHPENARSLAVAAKLGMADRGQVMYPEGGYPIAMFSAASPSGAAASSPRRDSAARSARGWFPNG